MKKGWQTKRLGDLFVFKNGRAFKKEEWTTKGLPIIRIQNLNKEDSSFNYFAGEYSQDILVEPGDLLFSWSGTVGSSFGSHLWNGEPGVLNQHIFKIGLRETIAKRYAFHGLRYITAEIEQSVNGAVGLVHITKEKLNEFTLPVPPLAEQQRIVGLLDEAFEGLATAKANAEKNLQNARTLFESHLQSVFTQRGPGWVEKPLETVSSILNGYAFKSTDFSAKEGTKCIKITNVGVREFVSNSEGYLPDSFVAEYEKVSVKEGSIVLALTRTIIAGGLKVAVVPEEYDGALLNQRVASIIANEKELNGAFLFAYLSTQTVVDYVKERVNTLMQPNLSITDLRSMPIPAPPRREQNKITDQLDDLREETQRLARLYERKHAALEALQKSLLHQAFTGEL